MLEFIDFEFTKTDSNIELSKQELQWAQQEIEAQNADNYQNLIKDLNSIFPKLIR
jgi:hypothetical protein